MFDTMQIKTKFMRGLISKVVGRAIYKKTGYKVSINLEDIDIRITDDKAHVHLAGGMELNVEDLKKFTSFIDKD